MGHQFAYYDNYIYMGEVVLYSNKQCRWFPKDGGETPMHGEWAMEPIFPLVKIGFDHEYNKAAPERYKERVRFIAGTIPCPSGFDWQGHPIHMKETGQWFKKIGQQEPFLRRTNHWRGPITWDFFKSFDPLEPCRVPVKPSVQSNGKLTPFLETT